MTPEEQEAAADRRATRNIIAAVLFLIGVLILLLFLPLDSAGLRSVRRMVFGKGIATKVETKNPGEQSTPEGNSIGRLPAEVQLRPPVEEVRAGAVGAEEPAERVGAPSATNSANISLDLGDETTAPPQPLLLDDFSQRLQQAGARSGDVQISLEWKNKNDLDLHVIDPFREEIFYRNRISQSGGQLDVDMNLVRLDNGVEVAEDVARLTDKPVENVYWPEKGAARGMYRVEVVHFARHGAPDPTPFSVRVINRGQAFYYRGVVSYHPNPARARVTVCTFMVQ